jgi:hypothetical protein
MGFPVVHLVGLDHYNDPDDVEHFTPDYFSPLTIWSKPKLDKIEHSYQLARNAYDQYGRILLNMTKETKLKDTIIRSGV